MKHIRVRKAATGWTIRIEERSDRALEGSEKSELSLELPKRLFASVDTCLATTSGTIHSRITQIFRCDRKPGFRPLLACSPTLPPGCEIVFGRCHLPTGYPICILLQPVGLQYPKTPRLTPLNLASGIPLTIGVEIVDMSSRTKATKKRTVKGVAGRSIVSVALEKRIARVTTWNRLGDTIKASNRRAAVI